MKANELRIGNWVKLKCSDPIENYQVTQILERGVNCGNVGMLYNMVEPIPLTEEWLVKLENDVSFRLRFIKSIAAFEVQRKYVGIESGEEWIFISNVRYVHEWQNLYHSLTGEELELKP